MSVIYIDGQYRPVGQINNNNKKLNEILENSSEEMNSFYEVGLSIQNLLREINAVQQTANTAQTTASKASTNANKALNRRFYYPLQSNGTESVSFLIGTAWNDSFAGLGVGRSGGLGVIPAGMEYSDYDETSPDAGFSFLKKPTKIIGGIRSARVHKTADMDNALETIHTDGKYYQIETDTSGRAFVNVPISENNTIPRAGSTELGGILVCDTIVTTTWDCPSTGTLFGYGVLITKDGLAGVMLREAMNGGSFYSFGLVHGTEVGYINGKWFCQIVEGYPYIKINLPLINSMTDYTQVCTDGQALYSKVTLMGTATSTVGGIVIGTESDYNTAKKRWYCHIDPDGVPYIPIEASQGLEITDNVIKASIGTGLEFINSYICPALGEHLIFNDDKKISIDIDSLKTALGL